MKITKETLKQIIKEETSTLLNESEAVRNASYKFDKYADELDATALIDHIMAFFRNVEEKAAELGDEEANRAALDATILTILNGFTAVGHHDDVAVKIEKLLSQQGNNGI